jgi:hypothetical protein
MSRRLAAASLLCALVAVISRARAADAPDTLTPRRTAATFYTALESGDVAGAKAVATGSEKQLAMLDSLVPFVHACKELENAAFKKWGEEGRKVLTQTPNSPASFDFKQRLQTDREEIAGDSASLVTTDPQAIDKTPIKLKKVAGQWKIDLSTVQDEGMDDPKYAKSLKDLADAAANVAGEIEHGKYSDVASAKTALNEKIISALGLTGAPAERKK